jgi:hypothetical protein
MIGKLSNDAGPIAEGVEITIAPDHRRLDETDGWRGEAWLSTQSHVLPGDHLLLELNDGSSSPVVIERVTVDTRAGQMLVRFTGSGPLDGKSPR